MTEDPTTTRTVFITGSSSGIGYATARHFWEQGWNVAATMRTPEKGADLEELNRVEVLELDVTKPETIEGAVERAVDVFGRLDAVINGAGFATVGPFEAATSEQVRRQFDTNVFGVMNVTKAVLPKLREQGHGTLVNVSSVVGRVTFPFGSLYAATKFAVEGFSESLHYELEPLGIRVVLIEPGTVDTPFNTENQEYLVDPNVTDYQPTVERMMAAYSEGDLLAQISTPEAVAEVIHGAVTEGGTQLRYLVGADASRYVELRERGFEGFRSMVRQDFLGLER